MVAQLERQLAEARHHAIRDKEDVRQARAEAEDLRATIAALKLEIDTLRNGVPRDIDIENSRFYALIKSYYGLYNQPYIGPALRGLRRVVAFGMRLTAPDRAP